MNTTSSIRKRPKIAVVGSINMDLVVRLEKLPSPGETLIGIDSEEICGGKGANQAVAAARMGGQVVMVGKVGRDSFAEKLITNLRNEGVSTQFVTQSDTVVGSGLAIVTVDSTGQNSIVVLPNANHDLRPTDIDDAENEIANSDCVLVQLEIPMETVEHTIALAKKHRVRIIVDPAPAPATVNPSLFQADLICPNESEATRLTGIKIDSIDHACQAVQSLMELGCPSAAITMGDRGVVLANAGRVQHIEAHSVDSVDSTAAGDAFAGCLAVCWSETGDLRESIGMANIAGALSASRPGAQPSMATRAEVLRHVKPHSN